MSGMLKLDLTPKAKTNSSLGAYVLNMAYGMPALDPTAIDSFASALTAYYNSSTDLIAAYVNEISTLVTAMLAKVAAVPAAETALTAPFPQHPGDPPAGSLTILLNDSGAGGTGSAASLTATATAVSGYVNTVNALADSSVGKYGASALVPSVDDYARCVNAGVAVRFQSGGLLAAQQALLQQVGTVASYPAGKQNDILEAIDTGAWLTACDTALGDVTPAGLVAWNALVDSTAGLLGTATDAQSNSTSKITAIGPAATANGPPAIAADQALVAADQAALDAAEALPPDVANRLTIIAEAQAKLDADQANLTATENYYNNILPTEISNTMNDLATFNAAVTAALDAATTLYGIVASPPAISGFPTPPATEDAAGMFQVESLSLTG